MPSTYQLLYFNKHVIWYTTKSRYHIYIAKDIVSVVLGRAFYFGECMPKQRTHNIPSLTSYCTLTNMWFGMNTTILGYLQQGLTRLPTTA